MSQPVIDKFVIKTIRILCQSLSYCQSFPERPFVLADENVYRCGDLAAAIVSALKDCPLLTARYTSPEAKNTFKLALSLKDIQAMIHRGRTQTCIMLNIERETFIKALTLVDVIAVAEAVKRSPIQRVCMLDHIFAYNPRKTLMKVD
ncbi:hypothetical protein [Oenococcus oeni]|uniref:hypothetical protein n=1 Tax=Oenococcus oeni TaxID=1247 RepID=UPI00050FF0AC|nr:hypothetical protein [Oenococcus oeni]KGI01059.1 hypothetical protein X293_07765 [Oenococcus oeni IOEB_C52]OIM21894.1 hypothetical protein ATX60_10575 [Oenococcus oeni]OIM24668.1 hypothetical protein ATX60_02555 [Oenococcus oeni]SYW20514.1 conserved hypothetical protein [Oenococcus oeni]